MDKAVRNFVDNDLSLLLSDKQGRLLVLPKGLKQNYPTAQGFRPAPSLEKRRSGIGSMFPSQPRRLIWGQRKDPGGHQLNTLTVDDHYAIRHSSSEGRL